MKREELRIGNFLQLFGRYGRVMLINYENIDLYDENYDDGKGTFDYPLYDNPNLSPIPLTEEWLEKLGLINSADISIAKYPFGSYKNTSSFGGIAINYENNGIQIMPKREIKYVHELQNLYYALTGKELVLAVTLNKVKK